MDPDSSWKFTVKGHEAVTTSWSKTNSN